MTIVLVLVALGWAIFLGSLLKERIGSRTGDSVHSFRSQLITLERRVGPRGRAVPFSASPQLPAPWPGAARRPDPQTLRRTAYQAELRKRRRDVLLALVGVFAFSLLLVVVAPGPITGLACVGAAGLLGGYIYLLVQHQRLASERRAKVHHLAHHRVRPSVVPESVLRRSATN